MADAGPRVHDREVRPEEFEAGDLTVRAYAALPVG